MQTPEEQVPADTLVPWGQDDPPRMGDQAQRGRARRGWRPHTVHWAGFPRQVMKTWV